MGRWQVLESVAVADCALEFDGRTLDDLFRTAALALADTMVDPATIEPVVERRIALVAPALDLLLYDWLSELIYVKDREGIVFTDLHVQVREEVPCALDARVVGGPIEPGRTALRSDPKAVTFHLFALEPVATGWRARVVIDI
jgi:SHS2 domain-containing protein